MSPSLYSCLATILLGPLAALVGGIVVALLAQDFMVGVVAGIAGLAVGLVVAYAIATIWMNKWPTEYDPVDKQTWERAKREYDDSDEPAWDEEELEALNEPQSAMIDLLDTAEREHRDLTALEKAELKRLKAKESEMFSVHYPYAWREAIGTLFFTALFLGGTVTALVVTLLAGWLLAG